MRLYVAFFRVYRGILEHFQEAIFKELFLSEDRTWRCFICVEGFRSFFKGVILKHHSRSCQHPIAMQLYLDFGSLMGDQRGIYKALAHEVD